MLEAPKTMDHCPTSTELLAAEIEAAGFRLIMEDPNAYYRLEMISRKWRTEIAVSNHARKELENKI